MGWIIALVFVGVVAGAAYLFLRFIRPSMAVRWVPIGGVIGALVVTLLASYQQVEAGHVGLIYEFGAIVSETDDGPQFVAPWRSLTSVDVREQKARFYNPRNSDDTTGLGQIDAGSIETQNVSMNVTVNWRIDRGHVQELFREIGAGYFTVLMPSRVQELFKNETVKYTAIEITQKRAEIGDKVARALNAELEPYGLRVVSIQIDNLWYSGEFEAAIEQKQVATQQALRAQEQVAQKEAEARQAVADAKSKADSAIEAARGQAESTRINADAQANANRRLAESLTPELIRSQAIQKWTGNMPAILPAGATTIIDPASLFGR